MNTPVKYKIQKTTNEPHPWRVIRFNYYGDEYVATRWMYFNTWHSAIAMVCARMNADLRAANIATLLRANWAAP